MGYRPHHILDFQVKIGREVGGMEIKNTLTFEEVSEALDSANIHYFTQEDEHIIDCESLLGFNNASLDSKKSEIIKDLQKVASSCDYAKKEGQYRIWWF
ncbi:hypothetical protein [uncultured Helicobacter sp.]|uniref:hypothetical protein n=1 Tax=uncultured Helicobacter sp. TaxID=175537 RepID=UPI00260FE557|nr:hypothetical protein [uncultured Helicobacter sp.]